MASSMLAAHASRGRQRRCPSALRSFPAPLPRAFAAHGTTTAT